MIDAAYLIPLKARAWIDLGKQKKAGVSIDEKDIRKHKNDILRLHQLLSPKDKISLPLPVQARYDRIFGKTNGRAAG